MSSQKPQPDFCTLYDQHVARVYRYHLVRTGSPAEAEDLTAETFLAALESFARLRPGDPPLPWLIGIARHKLGDYLRRAYHPVAHLLPLETAAQQPAPGLSVEEQAGLRLDMRRVAAVLTRLIPERAEALALHYFAGLNLAEVGGVMRKSEEAAKKLVQRGLADLRQQLSDISLADVSLSTSSYSEPLQQPRPGRD